MRFQRQVAVHDVLTRHGRRLKPAPINCVSLPKLRQAGLARKAISDTEKEVLMSERSRLEAKDWDSLQRIAVVLGGKPPPLATN